MRTIEEIQTELNALEASPSYYGNEWKKPRRERLKGELFDAITHGIPLDRLREICNADRIRSMTDEELAQFLGDEPPYFATYKQYIDWLRKPIESEVEP